jgi:hypothetical protein
MVNGFNEIVTLCILANMDIQLITSGLSGLGIIHYICNYMTKNSVSIDNMFILQKAALKTAKENPLKSTVNGFNDSQHITRDFFIRFFNYLQKCTQVAANEISTKLLKLPMCYSSEAFVNLYLVFSMECYEKYLTLNPEHSDITMENILLDDTSYTSNGKLYYPEFYDYIYRNEALGNLSFYDYMKYIERTSKTYCQFPFQSQHRLRQKFGCKLRVEPKTPNIIGYTSVQDDKTSIIVQCLLFQPFREFSQLNKANLDRLVRKSNLTRIGNLNLLHKSKEEAQRKIIEQKLNETTQQCDPFYQNEIDDYSETHFEEHNEDLLHLVDDDISYLRYFELGDISRDFKQFPKHGNIMKQIVNKSATVDHIDIDYNSYHTDLSSSLNTQIWKKYFKDSFEPILMNEELNYEGKDFPPNTTLFSTLSDLTDSRIDELIEEVSQEYTLNKLQNKAFTTIANSVLRKDSPQIIMYIGGQGGTGKSRIVKAITKLFENIGHNDAVKRMSFTGTSSYNIEGRTLHSTVGNHKKGDVIDTKFKERFALQASKFKCQIIDEISFCPSDVVESLDEVERITLNSDVLFGGVHTVFLGDFKQHLAINQRIYNSHIWNSVTHTIILEEQMRAATDQNYVELLSRARERSSTAEDYEFLKTKIIGNNGNVDITLPEWESAQFIIPEKELGFHINNERAFQHCHKTNQYLHIISSLDTFYKSKTRILSPDLRREIFKNNTTPKDSNKLYRLVSLAKGSKITLVSNIRYLDLYGLTNGCTGTVYDIVTPKDALESRHILHNERVILYDRPPIVLFKPDKLDPRLANLHYPGVPEPGIIPIFPVSEALKTNLKVTIKREQLPLTGAYAITDYKAQGSTYEKIIIDLSSKHKPPAPYVMLSRLTSSDGLAILQNFPMNTLNKPFDKHLLNVFRDIEAKKIM